MTDEPRGNPVTGLRPPKVNDKLVPVFTEDELAVILATCEGGGFQEPAGLRGHVAVQGRRRPAVRGAGAVFPSSAQKPTDAIDPVASHLFADPRLAAQPLNLVAGEPALPVLAVAFGGALVEVVGQRISAPSLAWLQPSRYRRSRSDSGRTPP